jgi:tetratricopeptide (TPR) repeat protein
MTTSRPNNEAIFHAARDIPDSDRRREYVREACIGDEARIAQVEALLAAADRPDSLLDLPTADTPVTTFDLPTPEGPGTMIGPYKLIEPIGEGGMGSVWMAQQTSPVKRLVAVKLIKAGMDTGQVIARFEAERQALALMDHANIARVLDGGTTSGGRPYFVMDLVKGVPITRYCDEHHLTLRERVELFIPVCQATQHAHQKGIIHRDLKPSNVLVAPYDGKAVVKVIDFGVAKAAGQQLTDRTLVTGFGAIVGTPEYMSPEQAELNNNDIDTRSDVYSLGVLLYELLTGSPPFSRKDLGKGGMLEMLRVIREKEPTKPSTKLSTAEGLPTLAANRGTEPAKLTRLVRGELDWIVMKALEKDRNRRYETATGFAADVQRYLADEPVLACPPSLGYRLRKFARRNKGRLAVAALVLCFLVSLGGVAGWSALQQARQHAAQRAALETDIGRDLDEVRTFCRQDRLREAYAVLDHAQALAARGGADEDLGGRVVQLRKDVDMAVLLEEIRLEMATVKDEHLSWEEFLLHYAKAFRNYGLDLDQLEPDRAVARIEGSAIREQLVAALDDWLLALSGSSRNQERLLAVLDRADPDPWRQPLRGLFVNTNLKALRELDRKENAHAQALRELARKENAPAQPPADAILLGRALIELGDLGLAVDFLLRAQQEHPNDFWLNEELGLWLIHLKSPRAGEAVGYFRAGLALKPDSPGGLLNLGNALRANGDLPGALVAYQKAITLRPDFAEAHNNLGVALRDQGLAGRTHLIAQGVAAQGLAIPSVGAPVFPQVVVASRVASLDAPALRALAGARAAFQNAITLKRDYADAHNNLGTVLRDQDDLPGALAAFQKAVSFNRNHAKAHYNLSLALRDNGDLPGAIAACKKAIDLRPDFALALYHLGHTLHANRDLPGARDAYQKAITVKPEYAEAHNNLGSVLRELGDLTGAIAEFQKTTILKPNDPLPYNNLGNALRAHDDLPGAIAAYQRAIALKPDYADAYCGLGNTLFDRDDLPGARAAFEKAIALKPDFAEAHANLGQVLRRQRDLAGARAAFEKAIARKPDYAPAHFGLGITLQDQGDLPGAVAAYQQAIALKPDDAKAWNNLGSVLRDLGDLAGAIAAYQKTIALKPDDAMAHSNLGSALRQQGDLAGAVAAYRKAIALKPDDAEAHCRLGLVLREQGEFAKALEELRRGHELGSKDPRWRDPSGLLVQQCQRLLELDGRLPDFLDGKAVPANGDERIELAQLCVYKQRHRSALRFYEEAFSTQPTLLAANRYYAARAAALAGCGQGQEADKLDDPERARLRRQALDWLRTDLEAQGRQLDTGPARTAANVAKILQHAWLADFAFVGVRGPQALAKLPEAERPEWQKLWKDVADMLKRAQEKATSANK